MVHSRNRLSVLKDETGNRILECAVAGKADIIVTGNKAMLALREYQGIRIITLSRFIDEMNENRRRK
ncbi:MAG: hypothetical protein HZB29_03250 [Nitrospinae bacterium]|nr:hypothetical protein [Nitrospinota bacterium]